MSVSGESFYVRGGIDDETASLVAEQVDATGATNSVTGIVERNGTFWVEDLPLHPGTNEWWLIATDAAGNVTRTNLSITQSEVTLTIEATPGGDDLYKPTGTVSGTVSDASYSVTVNGKAATVDEFGNWTAENVPLKGQGVATFDSVATSTNSQTPLARISVVKDRPPIVFVNEYHDYWSEEFGEPGIWWWYNKNYQAVLTADGNLSFHGTYVTYGRFGEVEPDDPQSFGWWDENYIWSNEDPNGSTSWERGVNGHPEYYEAGDKSGWGARMGYANSIPSISLQQWNPFVGISHYFSKFRYFLDGSNTHTYMRNSRTQMKLRTGGKFGINRRNLFKISANAIDYDQPQGINWGNQPDLWSSTPMTSIAPERIRIFRQNLGSDGNLFLMLPDNVDLELNANAPGRHYSMNVSATKHKLRIMANGVPLRPERIVPGAKFCVGQKIYLASWMSPSIDEHVENVAYEWLLRPVFVNYIENWPVEAKRYLIEWGLTYQKDTHAWWVTGGEKRLGSEWEIAFKNGQKAKVIAWGKLDMHRPVMVGFTNRSPIFPWITQDKTTLGRPWLQLGGEYASEGGEMNFTAEVKADFQGTIQWTQLINQYRHRDEFPTGSWTRTTDGQFWADGGEFYVPDVLSTELAPGIAGNLTFGDGPGNPVGISLTESHDVFKTYLRFKPSGAESIWVTLGRVDWSWEATAINLLGYPYQNIPDSWSITDTNIIGPNYFDDDTFPFWLDKTTSIDISF